MFGAQPNLSTADSCITDFRDSEHQQVKERLEHSGITARLCCLAPLGKSFAIIEPQKNSLHGMIEHV
jgi:hypothetical protein